MATIINTTELYKILKITPPEQNIMLSGRHGIGKSRILTDYFSSLGMKVVALFLGQMSDPGDLIGLPDRDGSNEQTRFLPPYWFPKDDTPIVLFLDELNRARPEVLQAIMDLALNRTIAGRSLPKGSRVISAVNEGDEYQLTDLDPALVSRFNIYRFKPSVEEWLLWARSAKLDERVINFINFHQEYLDAFDDNNEMGSGLEKSPDRRAWEKVSFVLQELGADEKIENFYIKAISGIIGEKAAAKFFAYINNADVVSGKQVLEDFSAVESKLKRYDTSRLCAVNDSVLIFLEKLDANTVPEQLQKYGENLLHYINFLLANNFKEVTAQFASNIANGTYPDAIAFMTKHAKQVFKICIDFVKQM